MKFQPGESGNLAGRPKNTGHRQKLFSSLVEPHKEALFSTAIQLALSGNEAMLRLLLERMLPAKPTEDTITIEIPDLVANNPESLLLSGNKILQALVDGEITPDQARSIMSVFEAQRKNIETTILANQLADIERTLCQRRKEKKHASN